MSYAPLISNNPHRSGSYANAIKVVLVVVAILFLFHIIAPQALSSFFTVLVKPFWNIQDNRTADAIMIESLQRTIAENQAHFDQANFIQNENEELKAIMSRSTVMRPLLAVVIKKPPFSAYDTFILDVGSAEGVKNGNIVYAMGNIPIGEIAKTDTNTSKAKLYSSSGEKFDISIGNRNISATAVGQGGGYFETSVAREAKISTGDSVTIPGLKNTFTGIVEAIISDPSEPFSLILFKQPVNIYELKWVLIDTEDKKNDKK